MKPFVVMCMYSLLIHPYICANPKGSPIQLYNYFDPDAVDSLLLASFEQLPEARLQLVEL